MKSKKMKTIMIVATLAIIVILVYSFVINPKVKNETYEHTSSMLVITEKLVIDNKFYIKAYDPNSSEQEMKNMEVQSEEVYNLLLLNQEYLATYTLLPNNKIRIDEIKLSEN